jgi:hypothetical protein
MSEVARFTFADAKPGPPGSSLMPLLLVVLSRGERQREAMGLLDTGAAVNVLPYSLGEQLGFVWGEEKTPLALSGNLARLPARGVMVSASVSSFALFCLRACS